MRELYKLIGKQGHMYIKGFRITVTIEDIRQSFGRVDAYVSSVGGDSKWVSLERIVLNESS